MLVYGDETAVLLAVLRGSVPGTKPGLLVHKVCSPAHRVNSSALGTEVTIGVHSTHQPGFK